MIQNRIRYITVLAIFILCGACDILRDSPFEVTEWSPGSGYHADPETLTVSISFSHDPDRASVEKHFSISGDGETVRGIFRWEGKKMNFLPFIPLEHNKDYTLRISANASDKTGLSMDWEFEGRFSTRSDSSRPRVTSFLPAMDGVMDQSRGTCVLGFSCPVSLNSLRGSASFSPSMSGAWSLEDGGTIAVFTPFEPWPHGRRYELRVSASLEGDNGMGMGRDFFNIFTVGVNLRPPVLTHALRLTENGGQEELVPDTMGIFFENTGWEKGDKLRLVFSDHVDLLSVGTALSAENTSPAVLETPLDCIQDVYSNEAVFSFERPPSFESRFTFRLKRGIRDIYGNESAEEYSFRIFANGKYSKPPSLVGIRIPMSPDDSDDQRLKAYGLDQLFADLPIESDYYPYNTKTPAWIECYFDCAPGASINAFSLMEMFRVETSNNVIIFSPALVRSGGFSVFEPHPGWEQYQRMEIAGNLTNSINAGLVHFVFNQGIRDSAGNASEKQFRISLLR